MVEEAKEASGGTAGVRAGRRVPARGRGGCCPFSALTAEAFARLVRPPFRKRHPVVFWGILVLLLACAGAAAYGALAGGEGRKGPALALVEIKGPIIDVSDQLSWIARIGRDEKIKGVLVRVDSPGGGAAASQELYWTLKALAGKKPVAVSMGSVAASGGLMAALAGGRIFANASTVTGSIGVRMDFLQVGTLLGKIGVGQETLTSAPYKDAGSPMRPLSPEDRAYFSSVMADVHGQFVDIVAESRGMDREKAAALADGRVFTGREALEKGLVDEIGSSEDARAWLVGKAGLPEDVRTVRMPKKGGWLYRQMSALFRDAVEAAGDVSAGGGPILLYR